MPETKIIYEPENEDQEQILKNIDRLLSSRQVENLHLSIFLIKSLNYITVSHFNLCLVVFAHCEDDSVKAAAESIIIDHVNQKEWESKAQSRYFTETISPLYCKTYFSIWLNILAHILDDDNLKYRNFLQLDCIKYQELPKEIGYVEEARSIMFTFGKKLNINDSYRVLDSIKKVRKISITCEDLIEFPNEFLARFNNSELYLKDVQFDPKSGLDFPKIKSLEWTFHPNQVANLDLFPNMLSLMIRQYHPNCAKLRKYKLASLRYLTINAEKEAKYPFPSEALWFKSVEQLDLHYFKIEQFPKNVNGLKRLTKINLEQNEIQNFPIQFAQLPVLNTLVLNKNSIKKIPDDCEAFPKLAHLRILENSMEEFPSVLGKFPHLAQLDLSTNELSEIEFRIGDFPALKNLWIGKNKITIAPLLNNKLPNLVQLGLSQNLIKKLPFDYFARFKDNTKFYLRNNKIASLPNNVEEIPLTPNDRGVIYLNGNKIPKKVETKYKEALGTRVNFFHNA